MKTNILERRDFGDQGTFGRMIVSGWDKILFSGELPWHDNKTNISCVPTAEWCLAHGFCLPEGLYHLKMRYSGHLGWCYWLKDVPGRSWCLVHPATYMGDEALGFRTQLRGCIALGYNLGLMEGQKAVLRSRPAVVNFMNYMKREPFMLRIIDAETSSA
jgi:hypothetical protein